MLFIEANDFRKNNDYISAMAVEVEIIEEKQVASQNLGRRLRRFATNILAIATSASNFPIVDPRYGEDLKLYRDYLRREKVAPSGKPFENTITPL